ncbi:MAG: O-acetyl-ADP-ribose deacetylase [Tissierellia bacterium]|nr:O-acetyl-ADP-ribose deacetylase [Tissierellia bacterium]
MIKIIKGDITNQETQAIVNAANTTLLGGGGVDGAIHRKAGKELLEECKKLNGCKTGEAKITKGYNLRSEYIIHTPGPVWKGGDKGESKLLENSYRNSFKLAKEYNIKTISFPSISTGVYRFPKELAAKIFKKVALEFQESFETIYMVCFDNQTYDIYKREMEK